MTKWEYMYAKAEDDKILETNGVEVGTPQGTPLGSVERQSVSKFLEESGQAGWELVGICPASESASFWRLVLKRPIA